MSEFDDLYDEKFFIIDSDNLMSITPKFLGYTFVNHEIVHDDSLIDENVLDGKGSYLFVNMNENSISINQDFNGSYGLYFYQIGDYFAISNSFFKLVEYLTANDHGLSLNKEFAEAFLFADLCSYAYCETLVNEITLLPKNYKVIIDKSSKEIVFEEIDYGEDSVSIDSEEGFAILDSWYYNWVNFIRSIKTKTNNLSFDLSGGMDSRIIAALWLTANIDLSKVRIKSYTDNLHVHAADYVISSKIADNFGFELNNPSFSSNNNYFRDILTPIDISFYAKLGFHKQMYFKYFKSSELTYAITGGGGESVRGYPNKSPDDYLNYVLDYCPAQDSLVDSTSSIVKRAWSRLLDKFDVDENEKKLTNLHYREVRSRHHFGKYSLEHSFANRMILTPLLDPDLYKINFSDGLCEDPLLIYALVLTRYCPELLEFEFEGGREIDSDTIEYAKKLNEKYPFTPKEYDFVSGPELNINENIGDSSFSHEDLEELLLEVYYSDLFEKEFTNLFSEFSYNKIADLIEKENYYPLRHVYAAISAIFVEKFILMKNKNINDLISMYLDSKEESFISKDSIFKLLKYNTIRMDIKCIGDDEDIEIISNSDPYSKINNPDWFKNKGGIGFLIESFNGALDLEIKCSNADKIKIDFRSVHIKDKNGDIFPIYVNYEKIIINGESVLDGSKVIWHDKPLVIEKDIKESESTKIHVEWSPFTKGCQYKNDYKERFIDLEKEKGLLDGKYKSLEKEKGLLDGKYKSLEKEKGLLDGKYKSLEKEKGLLDGKYKKLQEKNELLNQDLKKVRKLNKEILSSNSWKITKPLRLVKNKIK